MQSFLGEAALDRYDIHIADSYEGIDADLGMFDRVVLDLPEPWQVVPKAEAVLQPGGLLVAYTPSITQAVQVREAVKGKWIDARTIEVSTAAGTSKDRRCARTIAWSPIRHS